VTSIDAGSAEGQAIARRRAEIFKERYLPGLHPTRGANALLRALREAGFTLAVATSAKSDEVEALLDVAGAANLFEAAGSSDDVDRSKPDPDIVHHARGQTGNEAHSTIMIGDTPYDVEAARRAGVECIALRCGGWWRDDDLAGALAIYDDPQHLLEQWRRGDVPALSR
jgi:HAD superfamily hydrolase (TIGR01509 family)